MMTLTMVTLGGTTANLGFLGAVRGDLVKAPGGAVGRYVGRRGGLDWVCYGADEQYRTMCETFDQTRAAALEQVGLTVDQFLTV